MKNIPVKANSSGGNDTGDSISFGANEANSIINELENAVTSTGQTLATGVVADTTVEQLARSLTMAGQSASSYTDSGAADAYVLTSTLSTLVKPSAYFDGMKVSFTPDNVNTGASTINVSSIGAKAIVTVSDVAIVAGALLTTKRYDLIYVSTFDSAAGAFAVVDDIATTTNKGEVKLSTSAIAITGTETTSAVPPSALTAAMAAALTVAVGDGSWQTPSFLNSWSGYENPLRYRLINGGRYLRIVGGVTGSSASAAIVFKLSAGFIPATISAISPFYAGTAMSATSADGVVNIGIDNSGNVSLTLQSNSANYPAASAYINVTMDMVIPS